MFCQSSSRVTAHAVVRLVVFAIALSVTSTLHAANLFTADPNGGTYTNDRVGIGTYSTSSVTLQLAGSTADTLGGPWLLTFNVNQPLFGFRVNSLSQLTLDRKASGSWTDGFVYSASDGLLELYGVPRDDGASKSSLRIYDTRPVAQGVGGGFAFMAHASSSLTAYTTFAAIRGMKESASLTDYSGAVSLSVCDAGGNFVTEVAHFGAQSASVKVPMQVNGNLQVTGTITAANVVANFQDLAEWVPARGGVAAGTVVVIDPESNGVVASSAPYQTSVAGVVSEQPGLILGKEGPAKALVATTGRVKVRVDATKAPIHRGDLLVSSDTPGVAMKSKPVDVGGIAMHRPGTVIGKALEPLDSGTGEILVLLSLQ